MASVNITDAKGRRYPGRLATRRRMWTSDGLRVEEESIPAAYRWQIIRAASVDNYRRSHGAHRQPFIRLCPGRPANLARSSSNTRVSHSGWRRVMAFRAVNPFTLDDRLGSKPS